MLYNEDEILEELYLNISNGEYGNSEALWFDSLPPEVIFTEGELWDAVKNSMVGVVDNAKDLGTDVTAKYDAVIENLNTLADQIANIPTFMEQGFNELGAGVAAGVGGVMLSQVLGLYLGGVAKKISKDHEAQEKIKSTVQEVQMGNAVADANTQEMSTDDLIAFVQSNTDKITAELEKKLPVQGNVKWGAIIKKVSEGLRSKYGAGAAAMAGSMLYFKLFGTMPQL